ncbi:ribonucleotide reductase inhibitor [Stagonosporopsis vannaccii]|nr:ribonucleotide reductase inhibitor [Stagonosporopsis vannaccii]
MPPTLSAAPDQHRKKRPFQPAITSYFHAAQDIDSSDVDDDDDGDTDDGYPRSGPRLRAIPQPKAPHPTLAPALPDAVQASLLSVGMRVRKSVPEGYKTPKPQPPTHSPTPLRKPRSAYRDASSEPLHIPVDTLAATLQHQRELLPFCGLNKIGGYAEQPTMHPLFGATTAYSLPAQAFSQPFSSQDSGYGTDMARSGGKRGWSEEGDEQPAHRSLAGGGSEGAGAAAAAAAALAARGNNFLFSIPARVSGEDDIPVSPLSESPPPSLPPQRAYAQPRSRRRPRRDEPPMMDADGAMHEGRLAAGHASDFEEADFLAMDVDMDVDRVGA